MFRIDVFPSANYHFVGSSTMKKQSIRSFPHAVTRTLPAILPSGHSPSASHPQRSHAFIVGISNLTSQPTDRSADRNFIAIDQFSWRGKHEKASFRCAIKVIKHISQASRSPLYQWLFQTISPANHTFQYASSG